MGAGLSRKVLRRVWVEPDWKHAYETTCKGDSDVKKFQDTTEDGMRQVLNANGAGGDCSSLGFFKEITSCLLKNDEQVTKCILENEKDIWNSQAMSDLVDLYFENQDRTLKFYDELKRCLERVVKIQNKIENALPANPPSGDARYKEFKEKLSGCFNAGSPFDQKFLDHLDSIRAGQDELLNKLREKNRHLGIKRKHVKLWRKISIIVFGAALATVCICAIVAVVVAAPPTVVVMAAAESIPLYSLGEWLNRQWKAYEETIKKRSETVEAMKKTTYGGIHELKLIRKSVEQLERTISSICSGENEDTLQDALEDVTEKQKSLKDQIDSLNTAVEDIRERQKICKEQIDGLLSHVKSCRGEIEKKKIRVLLKNIRI